MQINEDLIRSVVTQVIQEVRGNNGAAQPTSSGSGKFGVFDCADEAVRSARAAFAKLRERPMEDRKKEGYF